MLNDPIHIWLYTNPRIFAYSDKVTGIPYDLVQQRWEGVRGRADPMTVLSLPRAAAAGATRPGGDGAASSRPGSAAAYAVLVPIVAISTFITYSLGALSNSDSAATILGQDAATPARRPAEPHPGPEPAADRAVLELADPGRRTEPRPVLTSPRSRVAQSIAQRLPVELVDRGAGRDPGRPSSAAAPARSRPSAAAAGSTAGSPRPARRCRPSRRSWSASSWSCCSRSRLTCCPPTATSGRAPASRSGWRTSSCPAWR